MRLLIDTFFALFPLYFYMATGALLRRMKILKTEDLPKMNALLFRSFLFFSLFNNVRGADFSGAQNGRLLLFGVCAVVLLFALYMLTVPRIVRYPQRAPVAIQAMYRSNFVLLGLAYAEQLCGPENIGPVSLLVSVIVPLFNLMAVCTFELLRGGRLHLGQILLKIVKNPLIIASALGALCALCKITFPEYLDKPMRSLGSAATPLAMVLVGASLTLKSMARNRRLVLGVSAVKLLLTPLLVVPAAVVMGFRDAALVGLMTAAAAPTAVASVAMSYELGGDGELAAQIVATTSLLSLVTMFLWILLLRGMGYC
ncbi:MAG: AEC family transporter [Clostridia bacterium]|nr:AEC family transporter [Clostridia bacterium]